MKKLLIALLLFPSIVQAALTANVSHSVVTTYTDGSLIPETATIVYRYYLNECGLASAERIPFETFTEGDVVTAHIDVTNLKVGDHVMYVTAAEVFADGSRVEAACSQPAAFTIDRKKPNAPINIEVFF